MKLNSMVAPMAGGNTNISFHIMAFIFKWEESNTTD